MTKNKPPTITWKENLLGFAREIVAIYNIKMNRTDEHSRFEGYDV